MFKTSMFDVNPYSLPMYDEYKYIKRAGFDSVMLGWRDNNEIENVEKARNAGLLVENIHAPFTNADSIWLDNLNGENYMKQLLTSVGDCKEYNIPTMVVHLSNEYNPPPPSSIGIKRLKRITEKAEHDNINIAFENAFALDHIRFTFDNISSQKLGFCFDSGHQNCMTPDCDLLAEFGQRLMAMHLNDNLGAHEQNKHIDILLYEKGSIEWTRQVDLHLLPFDGTIDWSKITRQLKAAQYKGAIAFEVHAFKGKYTPEEYYTEAFNRANKLWTMANT